MEEIKDIIGKKPVPTVDEIDKTFADFLDIGIVAPSSKQPENSNVINLASKDFLRRVSIFVKEIKKSE